MRGDRVIVVPYTVLTHETAMALDCEWRGMYVGTDDAAYFRLLRDLWAAGETFTIVEHDIIPSREALASLDECGADWCACPYPYVWREVVAGLGCTRFRAPLMERQPDVFDVIAGMADGRHPPMHWCRLDAWLHVTLRDRGEPRCDRHPQVGHVNDGQSSAHGCYHI